MRHIALKYAINGGNYQIKRFDTDLSDNMALFRLMLNELFFVEGEEALKTAVGHINHEVALCFSYEEADLFISMMDNTRGALITRMDEAQSINFKPLTQNQTAHDGQVYEDGYALLAQALANTHEQAESLGFVKAVQKADVINIRAQCAVSIAAPTWRAITTDSQEPNATEHYTEQPVHEQIYEGFYPSFAAVAPTPNQSYLAVYHTMQDGERLRVMLGADFGFYPFFRIGIARGVDHPAQAFGAANLIDIFARPEMDAPNAQVQSNLRRQPSLGAPSNYIELRRVGTDLYLNDIKGIHYVARDFDGRLAIVSGGLEGGDEWQLAPIVIKEPLMADMYA